MPGDELVAPCSAPWLRLERVREQHAKERERERHNLWLISINQIVFHTYEQILTNLS